ncbi:MAG: glycoside hydrolase family 13 protein [Oscillospiraceae bacterium]
MTISELSPLIVHDAANPEYRSPVGAIPVGDTVTLSLSDGNAVLDAELIVYCDEWEKTLEMSTGNGRWSADFTADSPAALRYLFHLTLAEGEYWLCADGRFGVLASSRGEGFRLTAYDRAFQTPAWFRRSVMYQIFPDRFARDASDTARRGIESHRSAGRNVKYHEDWSEAVDWRPNSEGGFYFPLDFFGGTLRGVEENLPYLKSLGIGVIYLNPIFEAASNHRYDTADYLKIDPVLGSNGDFDRLCQKALALGIRIMPDGVFSHTGADSVYFNKFGRYPSIGACNSRESEYFPWYDFQKFPSAYRCWWNFPDLPEVCETNPAWQDFVISGENSVVKSWLRRGASGWRLDVADELPDEVLSLIRTAAKEASPDSVILGEVWEDAVTKTSYGKRRNYALGASLDSVMNYPLRAALLDFFTFRSEASALCAMLLDQRLNYPAPLYYSLMNLLSSHDTERVRTALATRLDARALTREQQADFRVTDAQDARGASMQRLCAVLQFTLPGVPCIYYGDETGMAGMLDPFCRAPFTEGHRPLTDWYARLSSLRNGSAALSTGAVAFSAPCADVLCLLRFIRGGEDVFGETAEDACYLVCVNRAAEPRQVVADLWLQNAGLSRGELSRLKSLPITRGRCLLTDAELSVNDGLALLTLSPETAYVFRLE